MRYTNLRTHSLTHSLTSTRRVCVCVCVCVCARERTSTRRATLASSSAASPYSVLYAPLTSRPVATCRPNTDSIASVISPTVARARAAAIDSSSRLPSPVLQHSAISARHRCSYNTNRDVTLCPRLLCCGNVTSARWRVTLCDPMWHVSSRSCVATLRTAIHLLLTYLPLQLQYKPRRQTPSPAPVLPPGESLSVHASVDTCHHIDWQLQQVAIARLTTPGDLRQKPLQLHTQ